VEEWRPLVADVFGEWGVSGQVDNALAIIACESLGDPFVVNSSSGVTGLFQHRPSYWDARAERAGIPGANILSPRANTTVAALLVWESINEPWRGAPWSRGPWGHWECGRILDLWE
jgi:hypothetical protein